ncbi:MAG TPA: dephospho-CoA kinase [Syntrophales bacterium]|nr:dephospho-CoA kinase [Syntrophales bacterium]
MLNVGLTGGIGCGKSTVARMLARKGAFVIDFDRVAHEVQEPDAVAWKAVVAEFGPEVLRPDRTLDRDRLGAIVFNDAAKRHRLNEMVHPAVFEEWRTRRDAICREKPDAVVIADVPLLFEVGMQAMLDLVLLVYLGPEGQIRRIMKRNGYSREEAVLRLASQMPIDEKVPLADLVIDNEGTFEETEARIEDIWRRLTDTEREKRLGSAV